MAEVLIAITILAILLVAVATAIQAASVNYQENNAIFKALNAGRQALSRMTAQIRTGQVSPASEGSAICSLVTTDGYDITYKYIANDDKIYVVTNYNLSDPDYVLCDNVSAASFSKTVDASDPNAPYVRSVVISLTVTTNGISQTLSSAAVLRKNL